MRWFAINIRTFLLALMLALAVWISAVTSADPDEVRTLTTIPLEIIGQDPSLVITSDVPAHVEVTLRAPRSVWEELNAQENAVHATLDVSGLGAGDYMRNIQIQLLVRPIQFVLANPSTVLVHLEPLKARVLPVEYDLTGEPAIGYQAGVVTVEPNKVTISGPESLIKRAAQARILVSQTGARESIDQSIGVLIVDDQNNSLNEKLTISPEFVHINVPISQQGGFREVAVKVVVQGQVASGYRLENISVFPQVITVYSVSPDQVNTLPGVVETKPLNLQNAKENISTRLGLNLPENITVVGGAKTVQVTVGISPIQTSLTLFDRRINIVGLPAGISAQVSPQTIDVIVSGPLPVLDALTSQDVLVNVDVSGLEPGTHQLTPKVQLLVANVLVESILPGTVEVILSIPDTPTPTPGP